MAINPASTKTDLNNPTQRANELNDPQFSNEQGYFPYDLTHQEFVTPRFGEVTPTMYLHTVPGDRIVCRDNSKTVLNQINGNFLSTVNQYIDTFYVPFRSLYPHNVGKLFPNPTKGDDLPNSALPQFHIEGFINEYLFASTPYTILDSGEVLVNNRQIYAYTHSFSDSDITSGLSNIQNFALGRLMLLTTILSRGQLLDYLGFCINHEYIETGVHLQTTFDRFFDLVYRYLSTSDEGKYAPFGIYGHELDLTDNKLDIADGDYYYIKDLPTYRDAISTILEKGQIPTFVTTTRMDQDIATELRNFIIDYVTLLEEIFDGTYKTISAINNSSAPFAIGFINIEKCLAYQQIIAQYYSNDSVDNIYNSDLYMQLLRAVMFPSVDNVSNEPTFDYNGVPTEYDLISHGATYTSFTLINYGNVNRQYVFATLMFLLRRSLRYGDYFSTARPRMLAVGQLSIDASGSSVSPIDVTKNLLMQRYLNAANYVGSSELQYFASIYGVTPSDTGTFPRFMSHRKIELTNNIIENTSDNQGYQTTNLVGYSDTNGFDVYIDDFGIIMSLMSYDVLPVYTNGIDPTFHFADRFDYFNPMLQGIGDQHIRNSELSGELGMFTTTFGYTMRNAEYKYKVSRAHGAFVNSLPGYLLSFPFDKFVYTDIRSLKIDPDFIRDKPAYLDSVVPLMTGISPSQYYHFVCAVTNQLNCARKIQATPPVLF